MEIINTFLRILTFFYKCFRNPLYVSPVKYHFINHSASIIHFEEKCYNFSLCIFLHKTYGKQLFFLDCTHICTISPLFGSLHLICPGATKFLFLFTLFQTALFHLISSTCFYLLVCYNVHIFIKLYIFERRYLWTDMH